MDTDSDELEKTRAEHSEREGREDSRLPTPQPVFVIAIVMAFLILSPMITFQLFGPGPMEFSWPEKWEYMLDLQISQLEPLLISLGVLWCLLQDKTLWYRFCTIIAVATVHMFVAYWLIFIRGEGGLRWLN